MATAPTHVAPETAPLEIVPLGGLGEFGMNMLHVSYEGSALLVDAGVMFPEPELLGVDLVIPELTYLQQPGRRPHALVLTHGHEDHIGAVPYVVPHLDGPIYGTPLTLALLQPKLEEHGIHVRDRLRPVRPGETVAIGPFVVEFLRVTHSMPDCVALAIRTPVGTIVHSGDFKFDQTPMDGEPTDLHRLAELGSEGVLVLLGDSTNVERKGFTGSELDVIDAFEEIFTAAKGKIVVAAFATSLYRIQLLVDLAAQFGRKVVFLGRGMIETTQIAQRMGRLRLPAGLEVRDADAGRYADRELFCLTTGSQGEPMAALPRIAIDDHPHIKLGPDDVVVISARIIPGNEKAIGRVMNHVARRGCDLVYEGLKHVHVSGHGSEEELKLMLSLVKPRYFVPIHGEYRQLARHAWVASRVSGGRTTVLLAEDGDVLRFDASGGRRAGRAPAGRVLIDGTRAGEVADEVLRDRRHLAADGVVVPVVAIHQHAGTLEGDPEVVTRGLVVDPRTEALLRELPGLVANIVTSAGLEERTDQGLIKERLRVELQRFFRKRAGRRPLILPVILEI